MSERYRLERDSMGELKVPADAYYGAQTARAVENFPISGIRFPRRLIRALGEIKLAASIVNRDYGFLDDRMADAIGTACREVIEGKLDEHFVVDVYQTGSGTSSNMNANEVIANRASELLGGNKGEERKVHPNDHVNMGQSSNDVIPTAIHLALMAAVVEDLVPALGRLEGVLDEKANEFDDVVKIGRTHLQDATPIRLGQEFSGYAAMVAKGIQRLDDGLERLGELAIGGTAVGTGMNTPEDFGARMAAELNSATGLPVMEAANHFEAQGSRDTLVELSGILKTVATSLVKIANDIRWLGSGPRCGFGELKLPAVQPGSSIMPGKVNPVMAESLLQVCAQVTGNDTAVTIGGQAGNFELNVMMPMMAHNLLQSVALLTSAAAAFTHRCLEGLDVDRERCQAYVEQSLALCTALAPVIGYDAAADVAKEAFRTGKTVREIARERNLMPAEELERVLDPRRMTEPGRPDA